MKTPEITCECCGGTGLVPLSPAYWSTLRILRKAGRNGASATEVHAKIDRATEVIEVTAVNNRLLRTHPHGVRRGAPEEG